MNSIFQTRTEKIITWVCKQIATLGPIGYLPAPGTMGTLCAIPLLIGLKKLERFIPLLDEGVIVALLVLLSVWIINKALVRLHEPDPSEIILDEVIGFFVVALFMPLRPIMLIVGFVYFRFFDILKPFGIDRLEDIPGGWGIMLDDIAAALCARICMEFTLLLLFK